MANVVTSQIIIDGDRNAVVKLTGVLDTSNESLATKVDPADFTPVPTQFRIDKITYSISSQLAVQLLWDATTDLIILPLTDSFEICAKDYGGLQNNAGAGKSGKILLQTTGWASGTQTYTIILEMVKQGV